MLDEFDEADALRTKEKMFKSDYSKLIQWLETGELDEGLDLPMFLKIDDLTLEKQELNTAISHYKTRLLDYLLSEHIDDISVQYTTKQDEQLGQSQSIKVIYDLLHRNHDLVVDKKFIQYITVRLQRLLQTGERANIDILMQHDYTESVDGDYVDEDLDTLKHVINIWSICSPSESVIKDPYLLDLYSRLQRKLIRQGYWTELSQLTTLFCQPIYTGYTPGAGTSHEDVVHGFKNALFLESNSVKQDFASALHLTDGEITSAIKEAILYMWGDLEQFRLPKVSTLLKSFPQNNTILLEPSEQSKITAMICVNIRFRYKETLQIMQNFDIDQTTLLSDYDGSSLLNSENLLPHDCTLGDIVALEKQQTVAYLTKELQGLDGFSYHNFILPIIAAQGPAAFLYFKSLHMMAWEGNEGTDFILHIAKKYGTNARNILVNLLAQLPEYNYSSRSPSIPTKKGNELIEQFIDEISVISKDLFDKYRELRRDGNMAGLAELKVEIGFLQEKVYRGQLVEPDFENSLYPAVSYHVFSPAIGLTQRDFARLNKSREDHREHVPAALDPLQYKPIDVKTGHYELKNSQELDLAIWEELQEVVAKVNKEFEHATPVGGIDLQTAEKLISMYQQPNQLPRKDLYETMYRYHLSVGGGRLSEGFEITHDGLMRYKEFIGDRIKNDLVRSALKVWREAHSGEYVALSKDIGNRTQSDTDKTIGKALSFHSQLKKLTGEAATSEKCSKLEAELIPLLYPFGLNIDEVRDLSSNALRQRMLSIQTESKTEDPDELVARKIGYDLVGDLNREMRVEVEKFSFEAPEGAAVKRKLEFCISKKKEHGVAGYNMGVCVTPDEELWDDAQFWNGIIFDPLTKQAEGGFHLLMREGNLVLPGINPSLNLLGLVDNEELFDQIIVYARSVQQALGLSRLLIPIESSINSNRTELQEVIRKRNYPVYAFDTEQPFSYSPHEYSINKCFVV